MRPIKVTPAIFAAFAMGMTTSCGDGAAPKTEQVPQICIDETIQPVLDSLLVNRMNELLAEAAYGAVMEVSTGNLLAVSSWGRTGGYMAGPVVRDLAESILNK